MLRYLILSALFYALTPGILLTLPKKGSKNTVALTHAVVYAGAYYVAEHLAGLKEGFQSGMPTLRVIPEGANPIVAGEIVFANTEIVKNAMAAEAAANGTTTPLYQSLTTLHSELTVALNKSKEELKLYIQAGGLGPLTVNTLGSGAGSGLSVAAPGLTALPIADPVSDSGLVAPITTPGVFTPLDPVGPAPKPKPKPKPKAKPNPPPKAKANKDTSTQAIILYVVLALVAVGLIGGGIWWYTTRGRASNS